MGRDVGVRGHLCNCSTSGKRKSRRAEAMFTAAPKWKERRRPSAGKRRSQHASVQRDGIQRFKKKGNELTRNTHEPQKHFLLLFKRNVHKQQT